MYKYITSHALLDNIALISNISIRTRSDDVSSQNSSIHHTTLLSPIRSPSTLLSHKQRAKPPWKFGRNFDQKQSHMQRSNSQIPMDGCYDIDLLVRISNTQAVAQYYMSRRILTSVWQIKPRSSCSQEQKPAYINISRLPRCSSLHRPVKMST